jgi:hypothetical protein
MNPFLKLGPCNLANVLLAESFSHLVVKKGQTSNVARLKAVSRFDLQEFVRHLSHQFLPVARLCVFQIKVHGIGQRTAGRNNSFKRPCCLDGLFWRQ